MRIMVMGAGGVGGYFGARLAAGGADVTLIARGAHGEAIRRDGLFVKSFQGDLRVHPARCVADPADAPPVDAVLFCVKLTDTETAARALLPAVEAGAEVFTLQNGVESAQMLDAIFGKGRTVAGAAYISSTLGAPGHVIHTGQVPRLEFGEADGKKSARVTSIVDAFRAAGVQAQVVPNIQQSLWRKMSGLASIASITTLTRAPIGPIRSEPRSRRLLKALVDEAVAVGVAKNVGMAASDAALIFAVIDALDPAMRASMAFDIEHGKPLESPYLSGAIVRIGEKLGVPTPTHQFFCDALAVWEKGSGGTAP
ncbi:MAG TPA: 2-dehydropantoate 2-reductase [Roseiarcus sp.]|nr:2-dehydropantoate 2-reductase [Roseiarcus sp.]